jgi:hypothetical protein
MTETYRFSDTVTQSSEKDIVKPSANGDKIHFFAEIIIAESGDAE